MKKVDLKANFRKTFYLWPCDSLKTKTPTFSESRSFWKKI